MRITEVRVKLMDEPHDRLLAFCSVTFENCFVIRDLKLIQGKTGVFVAMPSRKLTDRCHDCGSKNHLRARFCNQCGSRLSDDRAFRGDDGRSKLYADIAHPIHGACREHMQNAVLEGYERERILAAQPDYVCDYDDYGEETDAEDASAERTMASSDGVRRHIDPAETPRGQHRRVARHRDEGNGWVGPETEGFGEGIL